MLSFDKFLYNFEIINANTLDVQYHLTEMLQFYKIIFGFFYINTIWYIETKNG